MKEEVKEEANLLDFSPSVEAKETTFSEDILGADLSASGDPNPVEAAEAALRDQGEAVLLDFEAKYEAPPPPGREADESVSQVQSGETAEADLVDIEPTKLEEDVGRPDSAEPIDSAERPRSRYSHYVAYNWLFRFIFLEHPFTVMTQLYFPEMVVYL